MQLAVSADQVPYFSNWIGTWAMHAPHFQALLDQIQRLNISMHLQEVQANGGESRSSNYGAAVSIIDGLAIVSMEGVMLKHRQSLGDGISTVETRRVLRQLANDDSIRGVCLKMCTPGGSSAGTLELGEAVKYVSAGKPIWAYGCDLLASAGYWVASQCDRIETNRPCHVGSIGTYAIVHDLSQMAAKEGVKVHVIRAGEFKGMGAPGTEITEEQIREIQSEIDQINSLFLEAVCNGRGMNSEQLKPLATGQTWIGSKAVDVKLSDGVSTFESYIDRFSEHCAKNYRQRKHLTRPNSGSNASVGFSQSLRSSTTGRPMSNETQNDRTAFLGELAQFTEQFGQTKGLEYLTRGLSMSDAAMEFTKTIRQEHQAELDQLKASHSSDIQSLNDQLEKVKQERDTYQQRLEQAKLTLGESESVDVGQPSDSSKPKSMLELIKSNRAN